MEYFIIRNIALFILLIVFIIYIYTNWHFIIITFKIWRLDCHNYFRDHIVSKIDILLLILFITNIGFSYLSSKAHSDNCESYQTKIVNKHEYVKIGNSGSWVHSGSCNNPIHRRCICVDESYFNEIDKKEKKIDKKSCN